MCYLQLYNVLCPERDGRRSGSIKLNQYHNNKSIRLPLFFVLYEKYFRTSLTSTFRATYFVKFRVISSYFKVLRNAMEIIWNNNNFQKNNSLICHSVKLNQCFVIHPKQSAIQKVKKWRQEDLYFQGDKKKREK